MELTNAGIAKLLRSVAAAYTIKKLGNVFQIRAYENAADAIEHSTAEVQDLWEEGRLNELPNLGEKLQSYLEELFTESKVKHFEDIKKDIPEVVFELLDIPGIGPKTAFKLSQLGIKNVADLKQQVKNGQLVQKGFSGKVAQKIIEGIREVENMGSGRMLLPYASARAVKIIDYLKKSPDVLEAHPLGSLRRMVATVGDLDFSASSKNPQKVVEHFCNMDGILRVVDRGETKATVILKTGLQLDLLAGEPDSYGALLQHFTGSKNHNIHLRIIAEKKGLSLSEYGVKKAAGDKQDIICCKTEEELYTLLGMQLPDPEIREDTGEIEAALDHKLPDLVKIQDIKGDLHIHSNFPLARPSHGPGADSIKKMVGKAVALGYQYVGISDHPPGHGAVSRELMMKSLEERTKFIQMLQKETNSIRVLNGLEIDILTDGRFSVPDEALAKLDYCIAGIHSGHRGPKEVITKRLLVALESPHINVISHPTNRIINERASSEIDWQEIFKFCAKNHKLLEINAFPNRLDLRDDLVRLAVRFGVKFLINTDAHAVEQMDNMLYGVSVARRGWATKADIVNTWDWTKLQQWFKIAL